jgi:hypothetical protein
MRLTDEKANHRSRSIFRHGLTQILQRVPEGEPPRRIVIVGMQSHLLCYRVSSPHQTHSAVPIKHLGVSHPVEALHNSGAKTPVRSAQTIDSFLTLLCQATYDLLVPIEPIGGTLPFQSPNGELSRRLKGGPGGLSQRLVMMTGSDAASSDPAWTSCRSKFDDLCSESSCANVRSESAKWAKAEVDQACCRIVSSVLLTCGH